MDKNKIIEEISKMNDKQKAKIMSIVLEEFNNAENLNEFGEQVAQALNAAVRWLS